MLNLNSKELLSNVCAVVIFKLVLLERVAKIILLPTFAFRLSVYL